MKRAKPVARSKCIMYIACGMKHITKTTPEACPLQLAGVPCVDGYRTIYGKGVKPDAKEETFGRAAKRSERKARHARAGRQD